MPTDLKKRRSVYFPDDMWEEMKDEHGNVSAYLRELIRRDQRLEQRFEEFREQITQDFQKIIEDLYNEARQD